MQSTSNFAERGWDLLVRRSDASELSVVTREPVTLEPGEARLSVERFVLTSNNATYVALGEAGGYWTAFPAPDGFGRVPVWGFAAVEESACDGIAVGSRYFGLLPMSTDFVVRPERTATGFRDRSAHRDGLDGFYRDYRSAGAPDELDALRTMVWTAYPSCLVLARDILAAGVPSRIVLSSASSKTALGTAERLSQERGVLTHGLTSSRNLEFVRAFGVYDSVSTYDDPAALSSTVDTVFVDITRSSEIVDTVHRRLAGKLRRSVLMGGNHSREPLALDGLPGPTPTRFFAPGRRASLIDEIGEDTYARELAEGQDRFLRLCAETMRVDELRGPDALRTAFTAVLTEPQPPDVVTVVRPR